MMMMMVKILLVVICLIIEIRSENEGHFIGPLGKVHLKSNIPSPFNCNRSIGFQTPLDIQVSKTKYSNGDFVSLSWIPLNSTCFDDFIGLFFVNVSTSTGSCDYIDFEFVVQEQREMNWTMIHFRQQLEFRYFQRDENCQGNYSFIGRSPIIEPVNYNEVTQIHLSFVDRLDQMSISFVTNSNSTPPQCQFGLTEDHLNWIVNGTSDRYEASDMCEGKANQIGPQTYIDIGYLHRIILENLTSSTLYYYRVGNDRDGWSSIHQFRSRPQSNDETIHLIAYADMGLSPIQSGAKATIDRVLNRSIENDVRCILHIGDISYARGIGALWDAFMYQIEATASRFPYLVGIGNHEYDHLNGGDKDPSHAKGPGGFRPIWGNYGSDSGGECAVPTVHRFTSPSNGNGLFWFSFNLGPIHILFYSTEHDFRRESEQYRWIENDLSKVNRSETPWIIVTSHRPMYSSLVDVDLIALMLRLYIEPLLYKYHVDLNLYGHIHSYERTCPMYQKKCVDRGVRHVLLGMGGHDLTYGSYEENSWSIYHDIQFGYTHLIVNKTHLDFSYYHTFDDEQVADHFQIVKSI